MKNAFARMAVQMSKIDPRYIQMALAAFAFAMFIINGAPVDDPGGSR
jgi:hypothetical protein